ncbi:MAG: LysR substrate-binding domain-containing protein [Burkholderiaceae bacterium]
MRAWPRARPTSAWSTTPGFGARPGRAIATRGDLLRGYARDHRQEPACDSVRVRREAAARVSSRSITEREDLQRRLRASAVLELNSITAMRKALAAGLCCSALPLTTVRDLLDAGVIRARRIVEPEVTRDLYLVTQRERSPTAAFETIRALIRALVREEAKAGRWPATLLANPARRAQRLPAAATPATAPAAGRPAAARAAR